MAKAQSPVRLESSLRESATLAGQVFKRSAVEQVEFWASIGRLIAPKISPNELLELQAGLAQVKVEKISPVSIDPEGLLTEIDQQRLSGTLQQEISNGQIRYQSSLSNPGLLEQVSPEGEITVGQFINGEFKPFT